MMNALVRRIAEPILGGDIAALRLRWSAALVPGKALPPYEDVMLGSLGRLADRMMLVGGVAAESQTVLQAGQGIRSWIGSEVVERNIADFPPDCALALQETISEALLSAQP